MFKKKTILQKTVEIGSWTQVSRIFGLARELLVVRYLGANILSDVFLTAYKIPNSLRKIFAEGALSAAFVPSIVSILHRQSPHVISGLMTASFLLFEGCCLLIVLLISLFAGQIIPYIAPGFTYEQIVITIKWLQIVLPFIFFISSSALFAGCLQSVGHFLVPAISPIILNIVWIITILAALKYNLPIEFLCWSVLVGGLIQLLLHCYVYFKYNFTFSWPDQADWAQCKKIFIKFLLYLPSASIEELNLFIDTSFATKLLPGSLSLIYYANRLMGIPQGVFVASFATVLLPHLSRIQLRNPQRLPYYLLESIKVMLWLTIPLTIAIWFFSEKIFYTLFLSPKFTLINVQQSAIILSVFALSLTSSAINKILLNIYYALHITWVPALVSAIAVGINFLFNYLFLTKLGAVGLVLATSLSSWVRTILFVAILAAQYRVPFYPRKLGLFLIRYSAQLLVIAIPFIGLYYVIELLLEKGSSLFISQLLLATIGYWVWVGPLCLGYAFFLWYTKKWFKIRLFFLE